MITLKKLWKNVRKRGLKDINLTKALAVWKAEEIKDKGLVLKYDQIIPYAEQLIWRLNRCKECVVVGQCLHCECDLPEAMIVPNNYCSEGYWEEMKETLEEWKTFKEENGIQIGIIY